MNLVKIDFQRCKECLYCVEFCPKNILKKGDKLNNKGYYSCEVVDIENCTACGICARVCPEAAIEVYKDIN